MQATRQQIQQWLYSYRLSLNKAVADLQRLQGMRHLQAAWCHGQSSHGPSCTTSFRTWMPRRWPWLHAQAGNGGLWPQMITFGCLSSWKTVCRHRRPRPLERARPTTVSCATDLHVTSVRACNRLQQGKECVCVCLCL